MSLLLFFSGTGGGGGPVEEFGAVIFSGEGSFSATPPANLAAVAFAGVGSFTTSGGLPIYAVVSFEGTGSFLPIARFTGTDYLLKVVSKTGTVFGEVENARVGSVAFELNGAGGLEFTLPISDPDTALIQAGREVQLWRGNQLLFWGPIVRQQIGLNEASYQCAGLLWYFERRYMGRADRTNLLTNGDFENSETGWSFEGGVIHSVDLTRKVEGAKSLRLTGATADHVQYAKQTYTHTQQWHPYGDFVTVAAWVYVPSADYVGGAADDVGLVAIHYRGSEVIGTDSDSIDDDTVKDQWIPLEVGVGAVKEDDTVEVRLFPPHGVANYDLVTATLMESLSFWPGSDVANIVFGISDYAQSRIFFLNHGKSDLNIDRGGATTGIVKDVTYQFAEHRNIADTMLEYVRAGDIDFDFALTPTTRTLTVHHPRKGHHRSDLTLQLDTTVADFSWSWDGEAGASSVVVLGPGDGPDRPEGGAADTSAFGGLTLEWVESAPDDVTVGGLDDRAAERLRVGVNPTVIEATTLPGVGYIGQLQTGDTVPVVISQGPLAINATYRAVAVTINPHTDQATVTLNVET